MGFSGQVVLLSKVIQQVYSPSLVSTISVVIAAFAVMFAFRELRHSSQARRGQVYLDLSQRYSSSEMHNAIVNLTKWEKEHKEEFVKEWEKRLANGDKNASELDSHRRRISAYYYDLLLLYELGILDKPLAKALSKGYGPLVYAQICLPLGETKFGKMNELLTRFKKIDPGFGVNPM